MNEPASRMDNPITCLVRNIVGTAKDCLFSVLNLVGIRKIGETELKPRGILERTAEVIHTTGNFLMDNLNIIPC